MTAGSRRCPTWDVRRAISHVIRIMPCTVSETTKDEAEESHEREHKSLNGACENAHGDSRRHRSGRRGTGAHAVDSPAITLDARSIPISSADTSHAYTAYLVAEYDLSNVQPNATQSTYLDASGIAFFTVIGAAVITLAGVFASRARKAAKLVA